MKFRNLLFPILLLAAPIAQAQTEPEYLLVGLASDTNSFMITDRKTVKDTVFGLKQLWLYTFDFSNKRLKGEDYSISKMEIDCRNEMFTFTYTAVYDSTGAIIETITVPGPSSPIVPGSTASWVASYVCDPVKMAEAIPIRTLPIREYRPAFAEYRAKKKGLN